MGNDDTHLMLGQLSHTCCCIIWKRPGVGEGGWRGVKGGGGGEK